MAMTIAEICSLARQIAKAPAGYTVQSGQFYNLVCRDLLWHRDLRMNLQMETIAVPANSNGPFAGASNYLRTYDMWYLINGQPFFMDPVELSKYDTELQAPQLSDFPYEFAVDSSPQAQQLPQLIYIYPQANTPLSVTHRYFGTQPEILNPESNNSVPWFDDQDYLVHATAQKLMALTDDTRYLEFMKVGEQMLRKHLIMEGDKSNLTARIKLDPQLYRRTRSSRPTKLTD
jgi:hypothetical protein